MDKIPDVQLLKNIPELKYVNADNVIRYRAIMRFLYQQYQKLNYWLKPEQIYEGLSSWKLLDNYTLEQCQIDLEQLVEWGNLSSRHDGGRAITVEEYLRKKYQYLLTPYSIEIERLLGALETVRGYGGSLEPTLFDTIADTLRKIREKSGIYDPGEALELWNTLYDSFQKLHEASVDYIASLQTSVAEELMITDAFLMYKDSITRYLQDFVQTLQRRSYKIEGNLKKISDGVRDIFFEAVVVDEWSIPKLEYKITESQYFEEEIHKWNSLKRWFNGESGSESELMLLERATKDAIVKIVRSAVRIQERRRSTISRKKELDYLGKWFFYMDTLESAHKLAAFAFGLFPTRHLQGEDPRESDSSESSMWIEKPIEKTLKSRSRKKNDRQDTELIVDNTSKKELLRKAFIKEHKKEMDFFVNVVKKEKVKISELGLVTSSIRLQILQWISRCITSSTLSFQTPEGIEIQLVRPENNQRTTLHCEDGELELYNFEFLFSVRNEEAWDELLHWIDV